MGKIAKSLFGTATSDDIATLQRHMQTLNNNNSIQLTKAMAHQDQHLSSFIDAVSKDSTMLCLQYLKISRML